MADFIWAQRNIIEAPRFKRIYKKNMLKPMRKMYIYGKDKTYTFIQKENNFIIIIGYCCFPGESIHNTALRILKSFNESKILNLKKQLTGQFIIIIKKNNIVYSFGDIWQVRNIFYSKDFNIISSSISSIEKNINTSEKDLDVDKVIEYIAMEIIHYPSWLGNKTMHINIKRLRPFEYIIIDTLKSVFRIGEVCFYIDNRKELSLDKISNNLLDTLRNIIENPSFKDSKIGVTLTGGYDTRLVAILATNYYKNSSFRIALSQETYGSIKESKISKKIAKIVNIPIVIKSSKTNRDFNDRFYILTEGLSPTNNSTITPIIYKNYIYDLGLGGCFGTELFKPLDSYLKIEDYIKKSILKAKKYIQINKEAWSRLYFSIDEEFKSIREHYILYEPNVLDELRIFLLLNTAFFSSSILAPYNINGLEFEPYYFWHILEIAFKVPKKYMCIYGFSRWTSLVQKKSISKINYPIGRVMTTNYQPMLPLTIRTLIFYLSGGFQYFTDKVISSLKNKNKQYSKKITINNNLYYLSDGWDELFLRRIREKYNIKIDIIE